MEYSNINLSVTRTGPSGLNDCETSITNNIRKEKTENCLKPSEKLNTYSKKENKKVSYNDTLKISTYNVRTLAETGKFQEICMTASKYNLDFIALQEIRYTTDKDIDYIDNQTCPYYLIYASANKQAKNKNGGVGILINKKYKEHIKKYEKISSTTLATHINTKPELIIISVYAPTESSNKEQKDKFYNDLEEYIEKNKHSLTIIIGDFNAQLGTDAQNTNPNIIGRYTYHQKTNKNGNKLINFCESNSYRPLSTRFAHNKYHQWTWQTAKTKEKQEKDEHQGKTQIDHALIMARWLSSVKDCRAYDTGGLKSDHRILTINLKLTMKIKTIKEIPQITPDWEQLIKDKTIQENYGKQLNNKPENRGNTIQETFDKFIKDIRKANKTIPTKNTKKEPWITEESLKIREEREKAYKRYIEDNTKENKKKWKEIAKRVTKAYKKDKTIYYEKICRELNNHNNNNDSARLYNKVRYLTGNYNKRPIQIKDTNGNLKANNQEMLEIWRSYFENLLNIKNENLINDQTIITELPINTNYFEMKELEEVLKTLKNNKAPGMDCIKNESIKYGGIECKKRVLRICNIIYTKKEVPWQMITNKIIPIHKKGDLTDPKNYRGISLISTITKIYNKMLLNRIYEEVNKKLRPNQRGFRRNSSTTQAIHILRRILEGHYKKQLPIIITFIDFAKAFDSINREAMWLILKLYGIPDQIIEAIKVIYTNSTGTVTFNNKLSKPFKLNSGILQGDALAPFLFIIVLDYALSRIPENYGIQTHNNPIKYIQDLEYADDSILIDDDPDRAIRHFEYLEKNISLIGLKINTSKSNYMTNITDEDKLKQLEEKITKVNNYKYLGAQIISSLEDIKHRRALAFNSFWKMRKIWKSKDITLNLKLRILDSTCIPILLYGSETWIINTESENRINSFATTCYRYILGISKRERKTNEEILNRVQREHLIEKIRLRQTNFIKDTLKLNDDELIKTYLIYEPKTGNKRKGRTPILYSNYASILLGNQANLLDDLLKSNR